MSSVPTPARLSRSFAAVVFARPAWRVLLAALTAVVLYLALSPRPPAELSLGWDKLNHAAAFAALAFAGVLSFPSSRRSVWNVVIALLVLGVLIELLQLMVPGRSSEWLDLLGDAVGIGAGVVPALYLLKGARRAVGRPSR